MIDFSRLDPVIHERGRLAIMTLLVSRPGSWSFADLRHELDFSDGNLITHLRTLENAGYLRSDKEQGKGRPRTVYSPSPEGIRAFRQHLDLLAELVKSGSRSSENSGKSRKKSGEH